MIQQEKREMQDAVRKVIICYISLKYRRNFQLINFLKALEQLMAVREDMAKTRELGKALQNGESVEFAFCRLQF